MRGNRHPDFQAGHHGADADKAAPVVDTGPPEWLGRRASPFRRSGLQAGPDLRRSLSRRRPRRPRPRDEPWPSPTALPAGTWSHPIRWDEAQAGFPRRLRSSEPLRQTLRLWPATPRHHRSVRQGHLQPVTGTAAASFPRNYVGVGDDQPVRIEHHTRARPVVSRRYLDQAFSHPVRQFAEI